MNLDIRLLTAADDLEPDLDLARRAFGPGDEDQRRASSELTIAAGRHLAAYDGPALLASARYFDMRQWWRGRSLPAAGICSVKVAPEERGRGIGAALMAALLGQLAQRGYPLALLYPSTNGLYRKMGFEAAGGQYEIRLPASSLRALQPPDTDSDPAPAPAIRRAGPADAARLVAIEDRQYESTRACGPASYDAPTLAQLIDDRDVYSYLAPDGRLACRWNRAADELIVDVLQAASAATARALWSIVASHGTMAGRVRAVLAPDDPLDWLLREPDGVLTRADPWMLRLVDAPAAIAGRGFPAGASVTAQLAVTDALLPANTGQWLLTVSAGTGQLSRAETAAGPAPSSPVQLRLGARGLAALYAGTPLGTLRRAGLAAGGDPGTDEALDEAFGCTSYMLNSF